jgi:hypothetical protein
MRPRDVEQQGLFQGGKRREFMRKGVMAIAAAVALGAATMTTGAMAAGHGPGGAGMAGGGGGGAAFSGGAHVGGGGGGGRGPMMNAAPQVHGGTTFNGGTARTFSHPGATFNGGRTYAYGGAYNHGHYDHHHGHFRRGFGFGVYGWGGGPYYDYYGDYGCWRLRRVWTPFGWRWRRIYICY